jgi:hypothetical protein
MTIRSRYLAAGAGTALAAMALIATGCTPSSSSSTPAPPPSTPPDSVSATAAASASPSPPTVSPSPAPTGTQATVAAAAPSATPTSCARYAATHTFAEVTAAKENTDGSLTITAHRATVVCGGPDDLHYDVATPTETATVTPSGTVEMLTSVVKEQTVTHANVSACLAKDEWGRIFMVTGKLTAIAALTELYHP